MFLNPSAAGTIHRFAHSSVSGKYRCGPQALRRDPTKTLGIIRACSPETTAAPLTHPRRLCCSAPWSYGRAPAGDGDIGAQTLEKPNRGYGDTPSETDVDVGTTRAFARMIDTVIEQPATFLVPVA